VSLTSATDLALAIWAQPNSHVELLLIGIAAVIAILLRDRKPYRDRQLSQKPEPPKLPRKWRWPWQRKSIPWKLGSVTVDLRGGSHTIHAVVAGMSGTGKSTAVLPLLMGKMPALVVAFDNSRPIRDLFVAKGWTIWQPGGTIGWDILSGSAQVVSEALTAGFARTDSDTGYNRGLAQMRLWATMDALDAAGTPRTIDALVDALERPGNNPDDTRACRTWANRFARISKSLGPSLGHDLDLGDCLRRGEKVLILPNRFLSPEDAPLIGAIALVQARRVAQEVGDFLLIVEEAGQAGSRQVEMNALAQAGRDRGCPLIVLTQNMAKLPEEVVNNVKVWVTFAQESSRELAFAAERLRIPPTELQFEKMHKPGTAWVRSPDHNSTRVQLSLPKLPKPPSYVSEPTPSQTATPARRRIVIREVGAPVVPPHALPPPSLVVQQLLEQIDRSGHCHVWRGRLDRDGYGLVWWEGQNRRVHRIVYMLAYGPIPNGADGKPLDLDHTCRNRRCCRLEHLEAVSRRENVQRRWRVRGVGSPG
jgi:hypothetical protein